MGGLLGFRGLRFPGHCFSRNGLCCAAPSEKKADVAEHPLVFDHVGLLANEPPGMAELPFI
jgi:hypothetical protein